MYKNYKMNAKNILVSFLMIASILLLVSTVSAYTSVGGLANITGVTINGIEADTNDISVLAGETITLKVYFTAINDDSDVTVEAEIEGDKVDINAISESFDVENGSKYRKVLTLKIPSELRDEVNGTVTLNIELDGKEYETELNEITLKVQRPTYDVDFKSVIVSDSVEAGESFPVDIVLKNTGYNDLEDVYVTLRLPALELEKTVYLGDMVAIEDPADDDDTDTLRGRVYLEVPHNAESGIYTLEVEVVNEDLTISKVMQIAINNPLAETVIKSGNDLIILNPTDNVKVFKIVVESPASVSETIVVIPASSSKTVTVSPNAQEYDFSVNVLSGDNIVGTVQFTGTGSVITSPIVILTVVLAIIFLVLLVVLIVLIGKKPEKTSEEFGESYY